MVRTASDLTPTRSGVVASQNQSRSTDGFKKNANGTRRKPAAVRTQETG